MAVLLPLLQLCFLFLFCCSSDAVTTGNKLCKLPAMRAPPSKCKPPACFFKFIRPGLKCQLSIPEAFTKHLKSRRNNKTAILRRGCQKWPVKIVDHWVFGEGWETFVRGNGVQDFDFVVFKHEGDMVFDTMVFDASCCQRDYPSNKVTIFEAAKACPEAKSLHNCKIDTSASKNIPKGKDTYTRRTSSFSKFEIGNKLIRSRSETELGDPHTRSKRVKFNAQAERDDSNLINKSMKSLLKDEETSLPDHNHHPYFIGTLKSANCKHKLYLPKTFALSNGLTNGEMILKNVENEGSWTVNLYNHLGKFFCVHRGWHEFRIANGLEQGDTFMFELIQNGEKPVANISRISKETPKVKASHNRYFKSVATAYTIRRSFLTVPMDFARSNGLDHKNCEMVVMDEKRRLWPTKLCHVIDRVIMRGFREIKVANGLKEGDEFLFELVDNGNKPLMNFHKIGNKLIRCHSEAELKVPNTRSVPAKFNAQAKRDGSNLINKSMKSLLKAEKSRIPDHNHHPCLIRTLKSASSKNKLYLPKDFALSNGLIKGEMILKYVGNEGSWTVNLNNYLHKFFYLDHGWHEFCTANGLEQGDSFRFELIQKGKKPVAYISRISKKTPMVKAAHNPRFKSSATPYSIKSSLVNVPLDFARSNGLDKRNCEMIVMDGRQRLWPTKLCSKNGRVRIKGSREMQVANGLKEGDKFLFELVDNGNKPLMNFRRA